MTISHDPDHACWRRSHVFTISGFVGPEWHPPRAGSPCSARSTGPADPSARDELRVMVDDLREVPEIGAAENWPNLASAASVAHTAPK
jgi:hypothetical protein